MISDEEEKWHRANEAKATAGRITREHKERVCDLMNMAAGIISVRGFHHDDSKFDDAEIGPLSNLQAIIVTEGPAAFGSAEYERRRDFLAPMLKHHYAKNSHHPEHYSDGVNGMCLFDLMEMFLDWKAASERGGESEMSITEACRRFDVSPQLEAVFKNTAKTLKFKFK